MSQVDPRPGRPEHSPQSIAVHDLGRFEMAARAFAQALDAVCAARGPFVAAAADLHGALGDPGLAARYDDTFVSLLRSLDGLAHSLEEFGQALRHTGSTYRQADTSVFGGIP